MSILQLPRELFLQICEHLSSSDLAKLAGTSTNLYFATQEPLYANVEVRSFESLRKLAKLFTRTPKQFRNKPGRSNGQTSRGLQSPSRKVKELKIIFEPFYDLEDTSSTAGRALSHPTSAISRFSPGVKIHLHLNGPCYRFLQTLRAVRLAGINKLTLFLGDAMWLTSMSTLPSADREFESPRSYLWNLCFGGSVFPDLQHFELDTIHESLNAVPKDLDSCANWTNYWHSQDLPVYHDDVSTEYPAVEPQPWHGLKSMHSLKLRYTELVDEYALVSLFRPSTITHTLTSLEITNCPKLTQAGELEAMSTMLRVCLRTVDHLKLHTPYQSPDDADLLQKQYRKKITTRPEHHLCDIVRELGERTKSLDIALPYACSRMFPPLRKDRDGTSGQARAMFIVPREPLESLPGRLAAMGYKYRRLICWDSSCLGNEDEWNTMEVLAGNQGPRISWELVGEYTGRAIWHVDGCPAVEMSAKDVLSRKFNLDE